VGARILKALIFYTINALLYKKTTTLRFEPLFGDLRGNVRCSSYAHWKASGGHPISGNRTFSLALTADELRANIDWKSPFSKGVGHLGPKFEVEGDFPHQPFVHG